MLYVATAEGKNVDLIPDKIYFGLTIGLSDRVAFVNESDDIIIVMKDITGLMIPQYVRPAPNASWNTELSEEQMKDENRLLRVSGLLTEDTIADSNGIIMKEDVDEYIYNGSKTVRVGNVSTGTSGRYSVLDNSVGHSGNFKLEEFSVDYGTGAVIPDMSVKKLEPLLSKTFDMVDFVRIHSSLVGDELDAIKKLAKEKGFCHVSVTKNIKENTVQVLSVESRFVNLTPNEELLEKYSKYIFSILVDWKPSNERLVVSLSPENVSDGHIKEPYMGDVEIVSDVLDIGGLSLLREGRNSEVLLKFTENDVPPHNRLYGSEISSGWILMNSISGLREFIKSIVNRETYTVRELEQYVIQFEYDMTVVPTVQSLSGATDPRVTIIGSYLRHIAEYVTIKTTDTPEEYTYDGKEDNDEIDKTPNIKKYIKPLGFSRWYTITPRSSKRVVTSNKDESLTIIRDIPVDYICLGYTDLNDGKKYASFMSDDGSILVVRSIEGFDDMDAYEEYLLGDNTDFKVSKSFGNNTSGIISLFFQSIIDNCEETKRS